MAAFAKARSGNERRGASRVGNSATVASPGPAPKTIIALSSGRLAIRPRCAVVIVDKIEGVASAFMFGVGAR
jgi:hypothetical protein